MFATAPTFRKPSLLLFRDDGNYMGADKLLMSCANNFNVCTPVVQTGNILTHQYWPHSWGYSVLLYVSRIMPDGLFQLRINF